MRIKVVFVGGVFSGKLMGSECIGVGTDGLIVVDRYLGFSVPGGTSVATVYVKAACRH